MRLRATHLVLAGMLTCSLCMAAGTKPPDAPSDRHKEVIRECTRALTEKGFKSPKVRYPEVVDGRSGYSYTGQLSKDGKRFEFNCVLSRQLKLEDLAIRPL